MQSLRPGPWPWWPGAWIRPCSGGRSPASRESSRGNEQVPSRGRRSLARRASRRGRGDHVARRGFLHPGKEVGRRASETREPTSGDGISGQQGRFRSEEEGRHTGGAGLRGTASSSWRRRRRRRRTSASSSTS